MERSMVYRYEPFEGAMLQIHSLRTQGSCRVHSPLHTSSITTPLTLFFVPSQRLNSAADALGRQACKQWRFVFIQLQQSTVTSRFPTSLSLSLVLEVYKSSYIYCNFLEPFTHASIITVLWNYYQLNTLIGVYCMKECKMNTSHTWHPPKYLSFRSSFTIYFHCLT